MFYGCLQCTIISIFNKNWAIVIKVNQIINATNSSFLICESVNEVTLCNGVAKKMLTEKIRFWTNKLLHL